jgi:hypothetical protein
MPDADNLKNLSADIHQQTPVGKSIISREILAKH